MEVEANGKIFTLPDGSTPDQIGEVIDDYFSKKPVSGQTPLPAHATASEEPGMLESVGNFFTGADRTTPTMDDLSEVQNAPELSEFNMPAFQASLGTLTTTDPDELEQIFKQQYGDNVSFRKDEKDNVVVKFPSGEYALNKPGFSVADVITGVAQGGAFLGAGKVVAPLAARLGGGAITRAAAFGAGEGALGETALELGDVAAGGDFSGQDVALSGGFGMGMAGAVSGAGSAIDIFNKIRGRNIVKETPRLTPEAIELNKEIDKVDRGLFEAQQKYADIERKVQNTETSLTSAERSKLLEQKLDISLDMSDLIQRNSQLMKEFKAIVPGATPPTTRTVSAPPSVEAPPGGGVLDASAGEIYQEQSLINAAKDLGIDVRTTDIMQGTTAPRRAAKSISDYVEKLPMMGAIGRARQKRQREEAAQRFVEKHQAGGEQLVVEGLAEGIATRKAAAGKRLGDVDVAMENALGSNLKLPKTAGKIEEVLSELSKTDTMTTAPIRKIVDSLVEKLEPSQSFSQIRQQRTAFWDKIENFDPMEKAAFGSKGNRQLKQIYSAMKDDLDTAVSDIQTSGGDALNPMDAAMVRRDWATANKEYAEIANLATSPAFRNVLKKGAFEPEQYKAILRSKKPSSIKKLYNSLDTDSRQTVRNEFITDIASKLEGQFSPQKFVNALNKQKTVTDIFYKGDDRRALDGFLKVMEATKQADKAGVSTATGQLIVPLLMGVAGFTSGGAGLLAGGAVLGLNALFQRKLTRDILIKIQKAKKGSTGYDRLVGKLGDELIASGTAAQSGNQ